MITAIHIKDFVIVDQLELELSPGMTALTGETGAGKSILVDALGLALGDRADSGMIRHGTNQAEVAISCDVQDTPAAQVWLTEKDLLMDSECLIRRIITREGRSKAYINDRPVSIQALKELGNFLVDIHGQHEHQSLLRRNAQRQLLDDFAGNQASLQTVSEIFKDWKQKSSQLQALQQAAQERADRLELLKYQVQELNELALEEDEYHSLSEEHVRLAHAEEIAATCQNAVLQLYEAEDTNIQSALGHITVELEQLSRLDSKLNEPVTLLTEAAIQVQEAVDGLRQYADQLDVDPGRLQWLEDRLGVIQDLSRKHRIVPEQLPNLLQQLEHELESLDQADQQNDQLAKAIEALLVQYEHAAADLSARRQQAARQLNQEVSAALQRLGMPGARFEIELKTHESNTPSATGMESVDFLVSANPGQPLSQLSKTASGGELSRISLAIQVTIAERTQHQETARISTLVYDEVDTGIGGPTAEVVGSQLRALGRTRQVLCVTHLPQVASQAHHHLKIRKSSKANATKTQISMLSDQERIEEVARMLGGVHITDQSRAHANEMIARAKQPAANTNRGVTENQMSP